MEDVSDIRKYFSQPNTDNELRKSAISTERVVHPIKNKYFY